MWCNVDIFNQKQFSAENSRKKRWLRRIIICDGFNDTQVISQCRHCRAAIIHNQLQDVSPTTHTDTVYVWVWAPVCHCSRMGWWWEWRKKTHTATGQFKLSTVVVQKKATSTRTQRNSVNCPNTSTDSTLGSPPLHTGRIVHAYKCTYTHSTSKSQHIGIAVEEKECEWFGCIEYNIN